MTINYKCLGRTPKIQKRRYEILALTLKNATPAEISRITGIDIKQVYNDIQYLNQNTTQHEVSLEILKGMNASFLEMKIRELESNLNKLNKDSRLWLDTQSKIIDIRDKLMKLQGVYVEKVEHTITEPVQIIWPKQSNE